HRRDGAAGRRSRAPRRRPRGPEELPRRSWRLSKRLRNGGKIADNRPLAAMVLAKICAACLTDTRMSYQAINFAKKFGLFDEQWQPKVIAEMNDYQFKS